MLRENWLHQLAAFMVPIIEAKAGIKIPSYRIACGFPSRGGELGKKTRTRGQCWSASASTDGHAEILISPVESDRFTIASILAHELIHAGLPGAAHGPLFKKAASAIGHKAPFTTATPTADFEWVHALIAMTGDYPHARLNAMSYEGAKPKQPTRLIKCECSKCGYTVRTTAKWLQYGAPVCPVGDHGNMDYWL